MSNPKTAEEISDIFADKVKIYFNSLGFHSDQDSWWQYNELRYWHRQYVGALNNSNIPNWKRKHSARRDLLLSFLPLILGGVSVVSIFTMMQLEWFDFNGEASLSYSVNVVELIVGGAIAFASIMFATTYYVNSYGKGPFGGGGTSTSGSPDGVPPILPMPPNPKQMFDREFIER